MRLVIVKNGVDVVGKEVYEGDDAKIDAIISQARISNPTLTYEEVDTAAFDSETVVLGQDQQDWKSEKAKGTKEAIDFLAKKLGLE